MSVAEMKQKAISLIDKVENEKKLEEVIKILDDEDIHPSIEQIYKEAVTQYGSTLKRLAE